MARRTAMSSIWQASRIGGRRLSSGIKRTHRVTSSCQRVFINIGSDVGPYLGDLRCILSHNSINSNSFFVVAGIFPFHVSALFAASKTAKTED